MEAPIIIPSRNGSTGSLALLMVRTDTSVPAESRGCA
jgi:hypothetical protein